MFPDATTLACNIMSNHTRMNLHPISWILEGFKRRAQDLYRDKGAQLNI